MTKFKALALGIVIAVNAIDFIPLQWWLMSLVTLAIASYFFWLFVAKFRRDRRFAARSGFKRVIPHTYFTEESDNPDLLTPFQTTQTEGDN
jgi:hypothetical protein